MTSREGTGRRAGCTLAAVFGHHRNGGGGEQGRGRRAGENPREGAAAPGFTALHLLSLFCHYANAAVIETSSSPGQALLIARSG